MTEYLAWKSSSEYFGSGTADIEHLRKPWPQDATHELVETSYFGFYIPEENLNCQIYHWLHPKLSVCSGGLYIFRGKMRSVFGIEYMNFYNYLPMPEDIVDVTFGSGVSIRMIEPLKEFEISYENPKHDISLRFNTKAIMPPAFRPTGGHITQAMKNSGTLSLRGKTYSIGGYFSRDRSWGDPRTEEQLDMPPAGWYVGIFGDDLAFNVTAFDSPELNPKMAKRYPGFENGKNFIWGYVWKDGNLLGVKSARKLTKREQDGITPSAVALEIVDENDTVYVIDGVIEASLPFSNWPNLRFFYALTRWTCNGRIGYGDSQEAMYDQYIRENT
jgi:hypothetical protein